MLAWVMRHAAGGFPLQNPPLHVRLDDRHMCLGGCKVLTNQNKSFPGGMEPTELLNSQQSCLGRLCSGNSLSPSRRASEHLIYGSGCPRQRACFEEFSTQSAACLHLWSLRGHVSRAKVLRPRRAFQQKSLTPPGHAVLPDRSSADILATMMSCC